LKIAIISDWYSEKMGYAENLLPKALASLGHEVHLITTNTQVYFDSPSYSQTYEPFLGPGIVDSGVKEIDGYLLHRLPFVKWKWHRLIQIKGLYAKLLEIRPHVVQTLDAFCLSTLQAALISRSLGFKLFGESHTHASVFFARDQRIRLVDTVKWFLLGNTIGRFISAHFEKCYPISVDAADIAVRYFGISKKKIKVCSLGVDTEFFKPPNGDSAYHVRAALRAELGIKPADIVCIYTGRLTEDKNPLCLAKAIDILVEKGRPFRGLFVGNGTDDYISLISQCRGCVIHPFVPTTDLPKFYWSSDVGVWPRQESTSQLDAAACGLPLVLSNRIEVLERVQGNGILYDEDDHFDLAKKLSSLEDSSVRKSLGLAGAEKVFRKFSWEKIALDRVIDYEKALIGNASEA
jgi:glycosyltransferase involved in cell wall biosynthesis